MNFTEAIVLAVEKVKAWIQSGGVKWDHVSDKPFVKVGGDTLTWDGNTEGLVSVDIMGNGMLHYKVSDIAPNIDDFVGGCKIASIEAGNYTEEVFDGAVAIMDTVLSVGEGFPIIVATSDTDMGNGSILSKGTYFGYFDETAYYTSLTIPGYTGFAKEQIDPKVLPEALQFGKTTVQGDTLEWDGNTEGLVSAEGGLYKVSDATLSADDVENGCVVEVCSGGEIESVEATIDTSLVGMVQLIAGSFVAISVTDAETFGFPETGTFFMKIEETYVSSLTIPGYSGFTKTEINTIEPEYLPGAVVLYTDESSYLYATEDTSDTSKRITKAELQALLLSGRSLFVYEPMFASYLVPASYTLLETYFEIIVAIPFTEKDDNTGEVTYNTIHASYYTAEYTA